MPQANRWTSWRSYARTARMHLRSKGSHCICRRQIGGLPGEATRAARMHLRSEGSHCICRRQTGGLPGGAPREAQLLAKLRIPVFAAGEQGDSAELRA
ncbi:hypothetical protein [Paenibacillus sp. J45TS6]|uniref:hypothetical protein n=1 Tax=Paenibacillus sp. J45TS6 TaxID=2807196 RepID=UPI001BCEE455|nr:hypothetical protein [Paenibacillus sp. J45TS6]